MNASGSSSTPQEQAQLHLEQQAAEAAKSSARINQARLKQQQREAATAYGRALFHQHGERLALALEHVVGQALNGTVNAGPHYAGMLRLMELGDKGPRPIAAIALGVVLDRISQRSSYRAMASAIGRAIEEEIRVLPVEDRGADLLRLARRRLGRRLAQPHQLEQLRITVDPWSAAERFEAGAFLLELIIDQTELLQVECKPGSSKRELKPAPVVAQIMAANPPTPHRVKRQPMLVPPIRWEGMHGGGHLTSREPLVRSRQGIPLDYLEGQLATALQVVNRLQDQQLEIDPWMAAQQRIAWDANLRGLFPLQRDPITAPPRPQELVGPEAFGAWRRQCQVAHRDAITGRTMRAEIERTIRQAEQLAGAPCWFAWTMDFRGRLYTTNRELTHQGPDWQKALVMAADGKPCDDRAADWILKAAAGHWGVRGSWEERLAWGRGAFERMLAAAEAPLERVHLWRDAKDPWQFLSCCRALEQWAIEPGQPIRQLLRLDQTSSGPAIVAALTRDRAIARATNLIGSTRHDLYAEVAEEVTRLLRSDLEAGDLKEQRLAGQWLERGITRAMAKGPVMTTIYGAKHLGLAEQLVAQLDAQEGEVSLAVLERERLVPCRYLARKFALVLGAKLKAALELQAWLRNAARLCMSKNQPVQWTTPMGLPVQVGRPTPRDSRITTILGGRKRWQTVFDQPKPGELSARESSRSITANLVHSFDAAFAWAMVCISAEQGVLMLPTHDCFAVTPSDAEWLHRTLHSQLGQMYRPDWLAELRDEIPAAAGLSGLTAPPMVGTLEPGEIGQNPYAFS